MIETRRRDFVRNAALLGGGLVLPGCATTGTHLASRTCPSLAPVTVSADRVIRTVAGLRPYRAGGFVVRADALDDKKLVHNYGHGGAGITLSWGSSRLATNLGLPGHSGPVAVLGSGIMGLTTARLVQEAGYPVTLYAAALPPDTTSNIAGGQWSPASHYKRSAVTAEWLAQYAAALDYSWRRFQIMTGDEYGIRWLPSYFDADADETAEAHRSSLLAPYEPDYALLGPGQHPFPVERVKRFSTMYAEVGHLLRQLIRDVQLAGGKFVIRDFQTPAEVAALPERLVFNCTGLGAGKLFGDTMIEPLRGQLAVLLPQPEIRYAWAGNSGYMFPRGDGIVLGGTYEHGEWVAEPQPEDIARIVASHRRFFGGMHCG